MSEIVKPGAIRNTPTIERISHVSAEGIKEYASMELPRLVTGNGKVVEESNRLAGTKYKEVNIKFSL